jgi:hypothetical protein
MAYRPYPNADRALRQLDRHYPVAPEAPVLECLRPMTESFDRLRANARRAADRGFGVGTYVLSTRPGVVSGGQ